MITGETVIYEQRITIPKNTTKDAPVTEILYVHPGLLKQVEIVFPPGPAGLAHLQIWHWEAQVYPSNPNSDFIGDDTEMVFQEDLQIVDPPFEFVLVGWNEDDTYPHTPIVRMGILPFESITVQQMLQNQSAFSQAPTWLVGLGEG